MLWFGHLPCTPQHTYRRRFRHFVLFRLRLKVKLSAARMRTRGKAHKATRRPRKREEKERREFALCRHGWDVTGPGQVHKKSRGQERRQTHTLGHHWKLAKSGEGLSYLGHCRFAGTVTVQLSEKRLLLPFGGCLERESLARSLLSSESGPREGAESLKIPHQSPPPLSRC